jgi:hypothetical protein
VSEVGNTITWCCTMKFGIRNPWAGSQARGKKFSGMQCSQDRLIADLLRRLQEGEGP